MPLTHSTSLYREIIPHFIQTRFFPALWCVTYGQCPQNMMLLVMVGAEQRHLSWMLTGMKGQLRNKKSTTRSPMSNWTKSTRQIKIPTQKHPPRCIRTRRCCTCVSWSCSAQSSNRRKTRATEGKQEPITSASPPCFISFLHLLTFLTPSASESSSPMEADHQDFQCEQAGLISDSSLSPYF